MTTKSEQRAAARRAHWRAETELFRLPPWHTRPCDAGGDPPDARDDSLGAQTWAKARELREQLLKANPDHYRDCE